MAADIRKIMNYCHDISLCQENVQIPDIPDSSLYAYTFLTDKGYLFCYDSETPLSIDSIDAETTIDIGDNKGKLYNIFEHVEDEHGTPINTLLDIKEKTYNNADLENIYRFVMTLDKDTNYYYTKPIYVGCECEYEYDDNNILINVNPYNLYRLNCYAIIYNNDLIYKDDRDLFKCTSTIDSVMEVLFPENEGISVKIINYDDDDIGFEISKEEDTLLNKLMVKSKSNTGVPEQIIVEVS